MEQSLEERLLQAIKKDDINAFNSMMEKTQCGAYRLGRFPVLSLLYLYKSRKILAVYEESFLQITSFEVLKEPIEVSKKFSAKAGKCLRLYLSEEVSPLEMLLIMDNTKRLKRVYPMAYPSSAVRSRLKSIYNIKYSLGVKFEGNNIVLDRRPLNHREKRNLVSICLGIILVVAIIVCVPVTTVSLMPKPDNGQEQLVQFGNVDFTSTELFTQSKDIILPDNYTVERVNCKIIGGGKKIILGKGASLGEFNGVLSDVIIESSGSPIFESITENATIENVTINVKADVTSSVNTALVAKTNYGRLNGVTVNVTGKITALQPNTKANEELVFGGLVQNNNYIYYNAIQTGYRGVIANCTVNYSNFELIGAANVNASFGGIAGVNSGYVQNCTVTGEIVADTFDVAGVCSVNNYALLGTVNEANISQTSSDTGWNPVTSGIVLTNAYAIENCENKGNIKSISTCGQFEVEKGTEPAVSAAGIVYSNSGTTVNPYVKGCTNSGSVESIAQYRSAYAAGVCLLSNGGIESCKNSGAVSGRTGNECNVYAGGISTIAYSTIAKSVNEGVISAVCDGNAYAGGIAARTSAWLNNCLSGGEISVTAKTVYAGGVLGVGEVDIQTNIFGYSTVYCGTVYRCISQSKISVSVIDETPAYVGGIAGYIRQIEVKQNRYDDSGKPVYDADGNQETYFVYFGGGVTNSYFIGQFESKNTYFGNIVGVCGANIYEMNSYTADGREYHNFDGNYYVNSSSNALGSTVTTDGRFVPAADKGATFATLQDIEKLEEYNLILTTLKN
ncbi:MAG: hypothetical protein K2J16_02240 [Clostridia bacterium]|nr:hypothetical protein [Clostridia bacterium]